MKTKFHFAVLFIATTISSFAQENKPSDFNLAFGADLTSSYLWRGLPQGKGPAIQPWGELSYKGVTLGAWGSQELTGDFKEVDIYAKYTYRNISLQLIDLFFPEFEGLDQHYFNFKNSTTGHAAELGLSYNGSESCPFTLFGGMILYGTAIDPKNGNATKLNRSTYFEVNYLGKFKDYSYNLFAGLTPTRSSLYMTSGFSVFNAGVCAKKTIKVTQDFSVPLKLTLATNPANEKIFMTVMISL